LLSGPSLLELLWLLSPWWTQTWYTRTRSSRSPITLLHAF
jgi:hypothetical protein